MAINWHRQHKWSSIAATLFIILFCLSGIVLNHRDLVRDVGISRSVLPPFYRYENWSGGLMRGSMPIVSPEELRNLPMSLWNVALEVHTGRIFIGASATYIYVFVIGLLAVWCIVSGYMAAKGRRRSYNH